MKKIVKLFIILFTVFSITGCLRIRLEENNNQTEVVILSKDFPSTSDLSRMVDESDIVVVGEYTNESTQWNMSRNPINLLEEDTENYTKGILFRFNVSEGIKGDNESKEIIVNHRAAEIIKIEASDEVIDANGVILKEATNVETYEIENEDPLFMKPIVGRKYMLFLKKDNLFKHYYGAIEPFSIIFDENEIGELLTKINIVYNQSPRTVKKYGNHSFIIVNEVKETITDNITGKSLSELIQEVKDN